MGIETFREFAFLLWQISNSAENISQVAEALRKEDVIDRIRATWNEVPKELRTVLLNLVEKNCRNAKPPSNEKINIHSDVKPCLESWRENPSSFANLQDTTPQLSQDHPGHLYVSLKKLDRNRAVDAVRWRFYLVSFHRVKLKVERATVRGKLGEVFVNIISNSNLVDDDAEEVRKNCSLWANIGGRYEKIASSLRGTGSLILLPGDISQYKLEREIPMNKGSAYDTLIQGLETRGICEAAEELDAHKVADGILEYLCPTSSCTWLTPLVSEIHNPKYRGGESATDLSKSKKRRRQSIRPIGKRRQFHSSNDTSRRPPPPRSSTPLNTNRRYGMELLYHAAIQVSSDMYPEPQLQVNSND